VLAGCLAPTNDGRWLMDGRSSTIHVTHPR
jgi:hypothetical protein